MNDQNIVLLFPALVSAIALIGLMVVHSGESKTFTGASMFDQFKTLQSSMRRVQEGIAQAKIMQIPTKTTTIPQTQTPAPVTDNTQAIKKCQQNFKRMMIQCSMMMMAASQCIQATQLQLNLCMLQASKST